MEIQLYTESGGYVATPVITPFTRLPPVVIWGERAFQWQGGTRYKECFCYCIPPEPEKEGDTKKNKGR